MKRIACIVATLAIGGFGLVGCKEEPSSTTGTNTTPGQKVDAATRNAADAASEAGRKMKDMGAAATQKASDIGGAATQKASDAATGAAAILAPSGSDDIGGVRNAIEGVVTNALDRNNWKDMTDHLSKADRERLNSGKPDTAGLDTLVSGFKDKWRGKYTDVFSVMSAKDVYDPSFMALNAAPAGDSTNKAATATIAASHGLPELKVPVVAEDGKWRIDVPDSVSGQQLHDNIAEALRDLQKDPAAWPADKKQAYQLVTHRILMAVLNAKAGA